MTKQLFIIIFTLSGILLDSNNVVDNTCPSMGTDTTYEYIQQVTLNTLDNLSGDNEGYEDFTELKTKLVIGQSYEISLYPGHTGSVFHESWNVWIDYNNDGDYDDKNEEVISISEVGTITRTINIPDDIAANLETSMRVSMKYNSAALPCQTFTFGEVEDYTITLIAEENPCTDYISDGFEASYGNWNDGSTDCTRVTKHANTGDWSVRLRDNSGSSSSITTNNLALSEYDEITIDFSYYPNSMEDGEDFWLQISTDKGETYNTIKTWVSGIDFHNETRYYASILINNIKFSDDTKIRLRCDASANADQVYIDDVIISACSSVDQTNNNENEAKQNQLEVFQDLIANQKINPREDIKNEPVTVFDFKIYPNPARDKISFKIVEGTSINESYNIKLIDLYGNIVKEEKAYVSVQHFNLDINGLINGMYLVIIESKGMIVGTHKVLVSK